MLTWLRKKSIAKKVLWFLAIIIIPAFILWGAGSISKSKLPYKYIGVIDGKKIATEDFIESIKTVQVGLFLNYFDQPQALNKIQRDRKLLNRLAWEGLIIDRKSKKDKITASDQEVVNFITAHPLFSRGGAFDEALYKYILKNSLGVTPRAFEESIRRFLVASKYRAQIIKNVTVSDEEMLRAYKNEHEKAKVLYVVVDKDAFKDNVDVSESEIAYFYNENKENFKEPEKIILQYIPFPHKEEGEQESVLSSLKTTYEKLKARPANMEKIAESLNLPLKETTPFSREEIVSEIESAKDIALISFRLKPLVDVIPILSENDKGISYIIRVKEKVPVRLKTRDEVSPYIADIIKNEKAKKLARQKVEAIYNDAISNNIPLNKIAEQYNLELKQTELISRFDYVEGAGESYRMVDAALKLDKGKISQPIEARKGFVLIESLEIKPIDDKKFENDKETFKNRVLSLKKMKALEDWFKKVKSDTSLNVDLDNI